MEISYSKKGLARGHQQSKRGKHWLCNHEAMLCCQRNWGIFNWSNTVPYTDRQARSEWQTLLPLGQNTLLL